MTGSVRTPMSLIKGSGAEPKKAWKFVDSWIETAHTRQPCRDEQSFKSHVHELLQFSKLKTKKNPNHDDSANNIMRYSTIAYLFITRHPILDIVPWKSLLAQEHEHFGLRNLPDTCSNIRALLHGYPCTSSMSKFFQFSLPFVKHNRMSFPSIQDSETVVDIVRLIYATCCGIYPHSNKQPTWEIQVVLTGLFWQMLASSSDQESIAFCQQMSTLLRLALFENFLHNICNNMPADYDYLFQNIGTEVEIDTMLRSFKYTIDQFRLDCLQGDALDWTVIDEKAYVAIEKCNRLCRFQQIVEKKMKKTVWNFDIEDIHVALNTPMVSDVAYFRFASKFKDSGNLLQQAKIQQEIGIHALPHNIYLQQLDNYNRQLLLEHSAAQSKSILFVCLKCRRSSIEHFGAIRLNIAEKIEVVCGKCNCAHSLCKIFVPGRLIRLNDTYFYWCIKCRQIHKWSGTGDEMQPMCCMMPQETKCVQKCCLLCHRTQQLHDIVVLNEKLGCMQNVTLCASHFPYEHVLKMIYNVESLRQAVTSKRHK